MANEGLRVFKQFLRREELPAGRLRIGLLIGSLYFALGFTLLRTFDGLALLLNWAAPFAAITWALANVLIAICILGLALFVVLGAPRILVASLLAAIVALAMGTLVTTRTKASAHAGVTAGCAAVFCFVSVLATLVIRTTNPGALQASDSF